MNTVKREIQWLLKEKYGGAPCLAFLRDAERIKKGEPADYVIGWTDFLGCRISLSKKPLIPRPETEYWVNEAIKEIKAERKGKKVRCLDIFAGSGCIGIAALKHIPFAVADFAEKEKSFCEQIADNLKQNNIARRRYSVIQSDMFSRVRKRYDAIFANPPYVATQRIHNVQKSVLKWEPKRALLAGKDGLFYIKKFLIKAKFRLAPGGILYMEFDSRQKDAVQKIAKKYGYAHTQFFKDQYGKWRFAKIWI